MIIINKKGFTLIEVLVAMSIFIVISLIAVVNIFNGDKKSALKSKGLEMASNIRYVQSIANTALAVGSTTPRGWGIHFTEGSDKYIIFAKIGGTDWLYNASNTVDYKTINLGKTYKIADNGLNEPKDPDDSCNLIQDGILDVVFSVPVGEIYFNGLQPNATDCGGGFNPAIIILQDKVKNIKINTEINWISGRVSNSQVY